MASVVLVTGANGFIGTYATLLFESLGHRVVPIDIAPRSRDLSLLPIKLSTIELDVTDSKALRKLCKSKRVTHVVHAAHPRQEEGPKVLSFSQRAMENVLEVGRDLNLQRVLFVSSASIYGRPSKGGGALLNEGDPVAVFPTDLSRSGKMVGEWLGDFYARRRGINFIALRVASVYGPGQRDGIGAAIRDGLLWRECRPYLTRASEDLVFVKDVAEALRLASFCEPPPSRVYNIGSGKAYSEEELERTMRKCLPEVSFEIGRSPDSVVAGRFDDPPALDVRRARDELGFIPRFDLERGIGAIAAWVRSERRRLASRSL